MYIFMWMWQSHTGLHICRFAGHAILCSNFFVFYCVYYSTRCFFHWIELIWFQIWSKSWIVCFYPYFKNQLKLNFVQMSVMILFHSHTNMGLGVPKLQFESQIFTFQTCFCCISMKWNELNTYFCIRISEIRANFCLSLWESKFTETAAFTVY